MNLQRGEILIKLGGVEHILTPTFQAMAIIEARSGKGILALGLAFANMGATSADVAATIYGGVWGAIKPKQPKDMPWSMDELNDLIFKEGISKFFAICLKFLNGMVSGQTEKEGDEKNGSPTGTAKK